jgi:hypothetical protein
MTGASLTPWAISWALLAVMSRTGAQAVRLTSRPRAGQA